MYYKIKVRGVVQGVGFRPFIYQEAVKKGIKGTVRNTGEGVEIIADSLSILTSLKRPPPLAKIAEIEIEKINADFTGFNIAGSGKGGQTDLPADTFMCKDCEKELRDKKNRRYNYYFITCTNCGPRFTIIEDYPYDRPNTSLADFEMCKSCFAEYVNPSNRRFHAQTIGCLECGPRLSFIKKSAVISEKNAIKHAAESLQRGEVVAIKGIGGFHLASLPCSVRKIRHVLKRPDKPFALLAKDTEMVRKYAFVSEKEKNVLESPQRPIVILRKKGDILKDVSELDTLGFMLPYTALHLLLFDYLNEPVVLTSANLPDEPMIIDEKIRRLSNLYLTHERRIVNRCDDSVVKLNPMPQLLRRSRGFVPIPITLNLYLPDSIALGAEQHSTICVFKGSKAYLSQYLGNTAKPESLHFLDETVRRFVRLTRIQPKIVLCDKHPRYNTTTLAKKLAEKYNAKLIFVQHHLAHVASVMMEHNIEKCCGIAIDGTGYGEDGSIWGGEVFFGLERRGHLEKQPMVSGENAVVYPKRMLFGILSRFLSKSEIGSLGIIPQEELNACSAMLERGFNTPLTSSCGRVLDAASAFLGFCSHRTYDGRPAMLLEANSSKPLDITPKISKENGMLVLKTTPLFEFLYRNIRKDKRRLSATVQNYLAEGFLEMARKVSKGRPIVASGGCVYNRIIAHLFFNEGAHLNQKVPPGDGGIAFGQGYFANSLL
ncbi:MAG: carbamoyltransferase HypF [Candidatus Woesearchaeota archaeon]